MKLIGKYLITEKLRLFRLDLCYLHNKTNNNTNLESFLKQCYEKVCANNAIKNFSWQRNSSSWILKIGKRGSKLLPCLRKRPEIRFWIRTKRTENKNTTKTNLWRQIEEFEQVMTERFFKYRKKVLATDENYTGWLINYVRR